MLTITTDRKFREISREYEESEEPDLSALVEVYAERILREYKTEADFHMSDYGNRKAGEQNAQDT